MLAPHILVADDHPLFRVALTQAIQQLFADAVVREAEDFASVQALVEKNANIDLLLLDLHIPGVQGFSGLAWLRAHFPALPIAIVSAEQDPFVICRAVDHGVAGYIGKSSPAQHISMALRTILEGNSWLPPDVPPVSGAEMESKAAAHIGELTSQQFRVLNMLAEGLLNKQIAHELSISEATVKAHITAIMKKLGVNNRTQAVLLAMRLSVLDKTTDSAVMQTPEPCR